MLGVHEIYDFPDFKLLFEDKRIMKKMRKIVREVDDSDENPYRLQRHGLWEENTPMFFKHIQVAKEEKHSKSLDVIAQMVTKKRELYYDRINGVTKRQRRERHERDQTSNDLFGMVGIMKTNEVESI